jgi:fructose-bisphosphate aldolase, class II
MLVPPDTSLITRDQVRHAKPDPDLFLATADRVGPEVRNSFVIGDSIWDLLAARCAGTLGIGLLACGYGRDEVERAGAYAYPAINITSSITLHAALRGLAEVGSDGIVQVSTGRCRVRNPAPRSRIWSRARWRWPSSLTCWAKYPTMVALHTDHCQKEKLDSFVRPLIKISQEWVDRGENPLFQVHMWDGSAVPLEENLSIATELLEQCAKARLILEIEIGVVGGEEDGVVAEINQKLYTSPEDFERTVEVLGAAERGRYLLAATFGNVHGVYKPGNV